MVTLAVALNLTQKFLRYFVLQNTALDVHRQPGMGGNQHTGKSYFAGSSTAETMVEMGHDELRWELLVELELVVLDCLINDIDLVCHMV